jgi:iron complex transport system substrate-binding protein
MEMLKDPEALSAIVVDTAFHIHDELGPGLLESVYASVLSRALQRRGLQVEREKIVAFEFDGMHFNEGLRIDLLVNDVLVVELKSVELFAAVHFKQLLTYLRLMDLQLGLLINFGAATFKAGCRRVVNDHRDTGNSRLRINQGAP